MTRNQRDDKKRALAIAGLLVATITWLAPPAVAVTYRPPKYAATAKVWWDKSGNRDLHTLMDDLVVLDGKLSPTALHSACQKLSKDEGKAMYDLEPPKGSVLNGKWYGFEADVAVVASSCLDYTESGKASWLKMCRAFYADTISYVNKQLIPALRAAGLISK